eukprot:g7517.t1
MHLAALAAIAALAVGQRLTPLGVYPVHPLPDDTSTKASSPLEGCSHTYCVAELHKCAHFPRKDRPGWHTAIPDTHVHNATWATDGTCTGVSTHWSIRVFHHGKETKCDRLHGGHHCGLGVATGDKKMCECKRCTDCARPTTTTSTTTNAPATTTTTAPAGSGTCALPAGFSLVDRIVGGPDRHITDFRKGKGNAMTLEECAAYCRARSTCVGFTYYMGEGPSASQHPGRCQHGVGWRGRNSPPTSVGYHRGVINFAKDAQCSSIECCKNDGVACEWLKSQSGIVGGDGKQCDLSKAQAIAEATSAPAAPKRCPAFSVSARGGAHVASAAAGTCSRSTGAFKVTIHCCADGSWAKTKWSGSTHPSMSGGHVACDKMGPSSRPQTLCPGYAPDVFCPASGGDLSSRWYTYKCDPPATRFAAPVELTAAQSHCKGVYAEGAVPAGFKADPAVRYINDGSAGDPTGSSSGGVGFRGYWSTSYGVRTVAECAAKCAANPDCEGFNWWGSADTFHSSNVPYGTLCHMGSRTITSASYVGNYCAFTRATATAQPLKWKYVDATAKWTCPGKPYCASDPRDAITTTTAPTTTTTTTPDHRRCPSSAPDGFAASDAGHGPYGALKVPGRGAWGGYYYANAVATAAECAAKCRANSACRYFNWLTASSHEHTPCQLATALDTGNNLVARGMGCSFAKQAAVPATTPAAPPAGNCQWLYEGKGEMAQTGPGPCSGRLYSRPCLEGAIARASCARYIESMDMEQCKAACEKWADCKYAYVRGSRCHNLMACAVSPRCGSSGGNWREDLKPYMSVVEGKCAHMRKLANSGGLGYGGNTACTTAGTTPAQRLPTARLSGCYQDGGRYQGPGGVMQGPPIGEGWAKLKCETPAER